MTLHDKGVARRKIYAPALVAALFFGVGTILAAQDVSLNLLPFFVLCACFLVATKHFTNNTLAQLALCAAFLALGAARVLTTSQSSTGDWSKNKHIHTCRGRIHDFPVGDSTLSQATVEIFAVDTGCGFMRSRGLARATFSSTEALPQVGQIWQFDTSPKKFSQPMKRWERNSWYTGLRGTIFANAKNAQILEHDNGEFDVRKALAPIRSFIEHTLKKHITHPDHRALAEGMLLGGSRNLSAKMRDAFANAGAIHILAVSGMNVAIVAFVLTFFIERVLRRKKMTSFIVTSIFIFAYAIITQLQPSVLRATVMAIFVMFGRAKDFHVSIENSLGVAMLVLLFANPTSIFTAGFQLSFAATFGIIFFYPLLESLIKPYIAKDSIIFTIIGWLFVTIAAQLGTVPFSMMHFNKFQLVAPLANLFIVPAVTPATIMGIAGVAAAGIFEPLAHLIFWLNDFVLGYMLFVGEFFGSWKGAFVAMASPTPLMWVAYSIFLVSAYMAFRYRAAILGVAAALTILWIAISSASVPNEVLFLPTRSCSTLFIVDGKAIVFHDGDANDFRQQVLPALFARGIWKISILALAESRVSVENRDEITAMANAEAVFTPRDSIFECMSVKLRFVSPRNLLVHVCGKSFLLCATPPELDSTQQFDYQYIGFPSEYGNSKIFARNVISAAVYQAPAGVFKSQNVLPLN